MAWRTDELMCVLAAHRDALQRMGVRSLALFGSVARGEQRGDSDLDLLVEFVQPPGFAGYLRVKHYLEDVLGCPVDLVMRGALKPWARAVIEQEAIDVA